MKIHLLTVSVSRLTKSVSRLILNWFTKNQSPNLLSNSYNTGTRDCMVYIALKPEGWVQYIHHATRVHVHVITSFIISLATQNSAENLLKELSSRHMHLCSKTLPVYLTIQHWHGRMAWPVPTKRTTLGLLERSKASPTPEHCKNTPPSSTPLQSSPTPPQCATQSATPPNSAAWKTASEVDAFSEWLSNQTLKESLKTGLNHVFFLLYKGPFPISWIRHCHSCSYHF